MIRTVWVAPIAVAGGVALLAAAAVLPWAYVGGRQVGLEWVGVQAIVPAALLAAAAMLVIAASQRRRWTLPAATLLGLFAGYTSLALARAIPTMAAVRESADGARGPAFLVILTAESLLLLGAWATRLPARRAR